MNPRLVPFVLGLGLIAASTAAAAPPHGVNRAHMNLKVAPCEDFWQYANGAWVDTVQIPASYSAVSTGREVFDRNQMILLAAVNAAAKGVATEKDPTVRKVGILYATLMDSTRADRESAAPIQPLLDKVAAIKTRDDLKLAFAELTSLGNTVPFNLNGEPDFKNSQRTIGVLHQSGLGLPDRDYYFRTDPKTEGIKTAYLTYATKTFRRLGDTAEQAQQNAQKVMALETALAESSWTTVRMRDPEAIYHKMSVSELETLAPGLDWEGYFKAAGLPSLATPQGRLNVTTPSFAQQLGRLVQETPLDDWRAYLRFAVVRLNAGWLSQDFYDERFEFQSKISGQTTRSARWKRAVQAVDFAMGEAVGKAYVAKAFTPDAKARMLEMVDNLEAALSERIAGLDWMSDATKAQAQKKLSTVMKKVGYPDKWRDYSSLELDPKASGSENLTRAFAFEQRRVWKQIDTPVDRTEWGLSPSTVNAYYNPTFNEIVFPAGILQPPYFDPTADDALNYGAIGSVIGHELTHGFDDEGRKFDAEGNLKTWWTDDDDRKFRDRAQRVVDQFNDYVGVDTLHVNGQLTLGENIADLGGLKIAYVAYQKYIAKHGRKDIDGFTPEQRFFIGYAEGWRAKFRPEILRTIVLTNPHSPNFWRVNGPLSNLEEFRAAFGCKAGDAMVRPEEKRAQIW